MPTIIYTILTEYGKVKLCTSNIMSSSWLPPRSFWPTWLNQNNSENEPFLNRNSHGTGKVVTLDCTAWWLIVVVDMVVVVVLLSCLSNDSGGSWGSNGVSGGSNSWGSGVSSGKSWGSGVGGSSNWGSGSVSNTGDSWGSSDGSNWCVRDSVDWGSVSSDNSLGGVSLNGGVVDVWGLDNLEDK